MPDEELAIEMNVWCMENVTKDNVVEPRHGTRIFWAVNLGGFFMEACHGSYVFSLLLVRQRPPEMNR